MQYKLLSHLLNRNMDASKNSILQMIGVFFSIAMIYCFFFYFQATVLIPSFGASTIIIYSSHNTQAAQPRGVVGGHILSCITGVAMQSLAGSSWLSIALTLALCFLLMSLTNTIHPPAGGTGLAMVLNHQLPIFIIVKLVLGIFLLLLSVLVIDKFILKLSYYDIWFSKNSSDNILQASKKL